MKSNRKPIYDFFELFDKFINESASGKRMQKNGKKLTKGSVDNYRYIRILLSDFSRLKNFELRIKDTARLNKRELASEKNYWKKFYRKFSDYLYNDLNFYDNTAGSTFKIIRVFFNYLNSECAINAGSFHKSFYVHKENIQILVLRPEQLQFLISDKAFEDKLSFRLKRTKDIFVFGCTVALRISDLMNLNESNLEIINGKHYLRVVSKKTHTFTRAKLPDYAVEIIAKYRKRNKPLLPRIGVSNLNKNIRLLAEAAEWTQPCFKLRNRRGVATTVYKNPKTKEPYRFCDLISSHTMRRTAITTMLCLGMSEMLVRKISGHSPNSVEFFKYVELSQSYMDREVEKVHEFLREKSAAQVETFA